MAIFFQKRSRACTSEIIKDGLAAIQRLEEIAPNVIILDLNLPGIGGEKILEAIRSNPALNSAHVIICTANALKVELLRDRRILSCSSLYIQFSCEKSHHVSWRFRNSVFPVIAANRRSSRKGAGFEVTDLGVDVSPDKFVEAVSAGDVNIGALSALLTTTMPNMKIIIETIQQAGLRDKVKIIIAPFEPELEKIPKVLFHLRQRRASQK